MINKSMIAPIVGVVCLAIESVTHHVIANATQDMVTSIVVTVAGAAVSIWGIWKNHKKEVSK